MNKTLMTTYNRLPVSFAKGKGVWLWDKEGKQYLDAISGIGVCGLGHAHEAIAEVICEQSRMLLHTSNIYGIDNQEKLADQLCSLTGMSNAFFSNSGAEANEAAIKIARLYGHQSGKKTPTIIVAENSFHGRTLATLTATGNRKVQAGFEPLVQGFLRVPYNDIEAIHTVAKTNPDIVAVLIEPVQGEGGINIPDEGYLRKLRELCDEHQWLLMLDEIQSGMCRTGKWLACHHEGVTPDVVTLAKALGNGIPIGACLAHGKASEVFQPGNHGSTFGGNPFACRVASKVLEIMSNERLADKANAAGNLLAGKLKKSIGELEIVKEIRHKGLMIGVELNKPCGKLVNQALEQGLLINVTKDQVVRLLPPLIINETEIDQLASTLEVVIKTFE
jgi:acetylornithine aminotransferase